MIWLVCKMRSFEVMTFRLSSQADTFWSWSWHHNLQTTIYWQRRKVCHQFNKFCRMRRSSEESDRIEGVDPDYWTQGKRVKMTQEDLQEGRFQALMEKQVALV